MREVPLALNLKEINVENTGRFELYIENCATILDLDTGDKYTCSDIVQDDFILVGADFLSDEKLSCDLLNEADVDISTHLFYLVQ